MEAEFSNDLQAVAKIGPVEKILEVICRTTGLGFSAVARVTEDRWIACAVRDEIAFGLKPGGELNLTSTICNEIRQTGKEVVIEHVAEDPNFCDHHTPKQYGFQSYASFPITLRDGKFFGTLCAIDPRPALLKRPEILEMFRLFADLIAMHLDAQDRVELSEAALLNEQETAKLREQFIAVLGHDLQNPLYAISSGVQLLSTAGNDDDKALLLGIIGRSASRMEELVRNVLDFARGRLGGGFDVTLVPDPLLAQSLSHVIAELQTSNPMRTISNKINITHVVACDSSRIAQMLSNLIANALTHGAANEPIVVSVRTTETEFQLSVTNRGEELPSVVREKLFHPFSRGSLKMGQKGLGLGLYICAEIARAHKGTLSVSSENGETRFSFRMPMLFEQLADPTAITSSLSYP